MAVIVRLDVALALRKIKLKTLSELTGISLGNLSILKTGKARAIRFSTLDAICKALRCSPGDLLEFVDGPAPPSAHSEGLDINIDEA